VVIGLAPLLFWPLVARAVGAWNPAWAGLAAPGSMRPLGLAQLALAVLALAGVAGLWRRAQANGLRRALTWDCGYAAPAARMQYTGGSFGGIAAGWFAWILRPERRQRRPRGPFPAAASRVERVPETVLEQVIFPVGSVVMQASTAVRRLQHGRLQFYVLYIVVGLAALGVLVLIGGRP
jgi:hydrogenase-4 component B